MTLSCLDSKLVSLEEGGVAELELPIKEGANYVDVNRSHIRQWHVNPEPRSGMRQIPEGTDRIKLYVERGMYTNHYRIGFIGADGNPLKLEYL